MKLPSLGTEKAAAPRLTLTAHQHPILYLIPKFECRSTTLLPSPLLANSTSIGTCRRIPTKPFDEPLRGKSEQSVFAVRETPLIPLRHATLGIVLILTLILRFIVTPVARPLPQPVTIYILPTLIILITITFGRINRFIRTPPSFAILPYGVMTVAHDRPRCRRLRVVAVMVTVVLPRLRCRARLAPIKPADRPRCRNNLHPVPSDLQPAPTLLHRRRAIVPRVSSPAQ